MKDEFSCQVRSSELKIDRKDAIKKGRLLLPDYGLRIQEPFFFGGKDESFFFFVHYNKRFFFIGNAKDIWAEVPRFLETILE
ncbi:hypothetical protein J4433_00250 [Candidatus Pacearchaeota archaeon]|nr:hypothetical protein [Candidatus Pacearchaeota archaeon]